MTQSVNTIEDLRALTAPSRGNPSRLVLGYYDVADSGGGLFVWKNYTTSAPADDSGTIIKPSTYTVSGRWVRLHQGVLSYSPVFQPAVPGFSAPDIVSIRFSSTNTDRRPTPATPGGAFVVTWDSHGPAHPADGSPVVATYAAASIQVLHTLTS